MALGLGFDHVLTAAQAGAGWAKTRLYESLAPAVAGYLRAQGIPDPSDATSDVFVAAFSRLDSFRGDEGYFRSWVFTIAYRRVADEWRSSARRGHLEPMGVRPEDDSSSAAPPAEEVALARLGRERVEALLAELTPDQRQVLALRVIADLSIAQVAAVSAAARSDCGKEDDPTPSTTSTSTTSSSTTSSSTTTTTSVSTLTGDSPNRALGNAGDRGNQNDNRCPSGNRGSGNNGSGNSGPTAEH